MKDLERIQEDILRVLVLIMTLAFTTSNLTAPKNPDKSGHVERAVLSTIRESESHRPLEVRNRFLPDLLSDKLSYKSDNSSDRLTSN